MTDLVTLYTSILKSAGIGVDKEGMAFLDVKSFIGQDKEDTPFIVDGSRVVLPTPQHLNTAGSSNMIFHPLHENAMQGESKIVAKLRHRMSVRLSFSMWAVMSSLIQIAASPAQHAKLTPDQQEYLLILKDIDVSTTENFSKYIQTLFKSGRPTHGISIHLRRGGIIKGVKYNRTGMISFPAFKDFVNADPKKVVVDGVKFKTKDREAIIKMFEYIFPDVGTEDTYSVGSNSVVAPFMDSLMRSFYGVAARLNDVLALFGDLIPNYEAQTINSEWYDAFVNLDSLQSLIRTVPMQRGSEGEARNPNAPPPIVGGTTPVAVPQAAAPVAAAPVVQGGFPVIQPGFGQPGQVVQPQVTWQQPQPPQWQQPQVQQPMQQLQQPVNAEPISDADGVNLRALRQQSPMVNHLMETARLPASLQQPQQFMQPGMYQQPPMWQQPQVSVRTGYGQTSAFQTVQQNPGFNPGFPGNGTF